MRSALLIALLATTGLAQSPPVVATFNVDAFPNYKSMTIGSAHCAFWSHLALAYSIESACYINNQAKPQIAVYNLGEVSFGAWGYCEDGAVIPPIDILVGAPLEKLCNAGVAGGIFAWLLAPSQTTGLMQYHFVAWPVGGAQAKADGTF